jgi:hypothetical protein
MDQYGGGVVQAPLVGLRRPGMEPNQVISLLTAQRGLLNQTRGLYSSAEIERWRADLPAVKIREVPDVNHYTIVTSAAGASAVAREVLQVPGGLRNLLVGRLWGEGRPRAIPLLVAGCPPADPGPADLVFWWVL